MVRDDDPIKLHRVSDLIFRERLPSCVDRGSINAPAPAISAFAKFSDFSRSTESPDSRFAFTKYSKLHRYACHRTRDMWILITQPRSNISNRYFQGSLSLSRGLFFSLILLPNDTCPRVLKEREKLIFSSSKSISFFSMRAKYFKECDNDKIRRSNVFGKTKATVGTHALTHNQNPADLLATRHTLFRYGICRLLAAALSRRAGTNKQHER